MTDLEKCIEALEKIKLIADRFYKSYNGLPEPPKPDADSKTKEAQDEKFTAQQMMDAYNAGEAAADFDRKRGDRKSLMYHYFKTIFNIDITRKPKEKE